MTFDVTKTDALRVLRETFRLRPYDTVYTVMRGSTASTKHISIVVSDAAYIVGSKPRVRVIDFYVAKLLGLKVHPNGGIVSHVQGMDAGHSIVYDMGRVMFSKGFAQRIYKADSLGNPVGKCRVVETRAYAERLACSTQYVVLDARNGVATGWEEDGGYAFDHEWL